MATALPPLDANWLAHRYDPEHDAVHLLKVSREDRASAPFLIDDCLPRGRAPLVTKRSDAIAAAHPRAPLHFIIHSAYCCSTLLARAFDRPGWASSLSEPVILNDIVGWRQRGGQGADMASVLDDVLSLLARPFDAGEAVVVKPSTVVNSLGPAMLTLRPEASALLLYAPLETYLASIAKKGLEGRLWARTLLLRMLDDRMVDLGFDVRDHLGHSDLQVAAVGWIAQKKLFADLVARFGLARVRTLDSTTLMADPAAALRQIAALFGLANDEELIADVAAGPAFSRHSKLGTSFDARDRAAEHRDAASVYAAEIEVVIKWAGQVAATAGVALTPPARLLAD